MSFQYGHIGAAVALEAGGGNPERIAVEPRGVNLGVGTTARLKIVGEYKDGRRPT